VLLEYLIPLKSIATTQGTMFSLTLMSKGEKRSGLDATIGGPRKIVHPFRVSINAKGGDCLHVYRKSVLVIDGKNNNEPNLKRAKDEKAQKR
jgi:hypothetical protein